jgi:hypothetical protein
MMASRFRYGHKEMQNWYLYVDIGWWDDGREWEAPENITLSHPDGRKIVFSDPLKVGEEAWEDEDN